MQSRMSFKILAILALLALAAAACSDSSSTAPRSGDSISTSTSSNSSRDEDGDDDAHQTVNVNSESSVEVEAEEEEDQLYFKPSTLVGTAGQSITVAVQNEGDSDHTFTIDDQNVDVDLAPDEVQEVTVTFPESGAVEFYCRIHVSFGMTGELKVA